MLVDKIVEMTSFPSHHYIVCWLLTVGSLTLQVVSPVLVGMSSDVSSAGVMNTLTLSIIVIIISVSSALESDNAPLIKPNKDLSIWIDEDQVKCSYEGNVPLTILISGKVLLWYPSPCDPCCGQRSCDAISSGQKPGDSSSCHPS